MDEKTLLLEGLPDDLHKVKQKLNLYFKNKRRSGGEIVQIRDHPEDKRKALLVYLNTEDCDKVLEKKVHQIEFKDYGTTELTVKPDNRSAGDKREKPAVFPKPKTEKCEYVKSEQTPAVQKKTPESEISKGHEEACAELELLVTTAEEKNKEHLKLYFLQFTDNFEISKLGKNSWILKLVSQSDFEKILGEKKHDLGVSVKAYSQGSVGETLDPHRFILTGLKDSNKIEFINLFIKSCSQRTEHTWEPLDDDRIVVTFKQDIDAKSFLKRCGSTKPEDMEIGVSHLELTDSVLVQGDMSKIKEDYLTLYFSNRKRSGGGDIKSVIWVSASRSVVLSFTDCHDAQQVVQKNHHLCDTDLSTSLFYSSLQKALTGKTPNLSDVPANIIIPVDEEVLDFIKENQKHKTDLLTQLQKVHTDVCFDKSTSPKEIVLEMAVDRDTLAALRVGPTWESRARREAQNFLAKYRTEKLPANGEIWKRIENKCQEIVTCDSVRVSFKNDNILIVGIKDVLDTLLDKVRNLHKKAAADLEVEKNTVEKEIRFDSKETLELVVNRVQSKLGNVDFSQEQHTLIVQLRGLRDEVNSAEKIIKDAQGNVVLQQLNFSAFLLEFLKSLDPKKFEKDHFTRNNIPAFLQIDKENVGVLAEKENIKKAEDKIKALLKEEIIPLTRGLTEDVENRMNFLKTLKTELELSHNEHNVNILPSDVQIVICGFARVVEDISRKVRDYLDNKTPETEDVVLKSLREVEFVDTCMNFSEIPELRNLGVTVLACRQEDSPSLKVTAAKEKIKDAVGVVKKLVSSILVENVSYCKAGESKVLLKHEANVKAKAKEWHCKAYLLVQQVKKNVLSKSYTHIIGNQITLTIAQGDLLQTKADAFVCPINGNLAFDNSIAKEFLQVVGSNIQADLCVKLQKEKQTLLPGDVILSEPGNLPAKTLIYAVVPKSGQSLGLRYLESAVLGSLQKAEENSSSSIALPVLGRGNFGFSVQDSCTAIREAILRFSNNQQTPSQNLKSVLVVDSDERTVEEFNTFMTQPGSSSASIPTQPPKITPLGPVKSPKNQPGSGTEVTVDGVVVSLKKGDITKESVDVIVNSNNRDLNLDSGVSGAILKAAGKAVEDECKKHGHQKPDGVVLTSGGNLSCIYIAQMVGPNVAADITNSIEKVLNLCESKAAATVAVPAIGTGKGGIGETDSISAIFAGLENHLSRVKSSCLKEITVVAFEQKVFDAFSSYFEKNKQSPSTGIQTTKHTLPANQVKIGGVMVEVKKGNITNESVRGIVNTTNSDMNLSNGVSGAIFKAAGPAVQQECKQHGPLKSDTAAVTSAGNLQCDFIIHMMGPHSAADARLRVEKVLERCEEKQISTVSFPAVGTGGGGVKSADSIIAMLQGFEDHFSQRTSSAIKLIYIVIDQDPIFNEFLQGLKQWTTNQASSDQQDSQDESDCDDSEEMEDDDEYESYQGSDEDSLEEEDDNSANTAEAIIGPLKVKVLCGDITKVTTEAIVSSTNTNLNLSSGVSGAILKAAGKTVEEECKKHGTQPNDGVVLTTAGNLAVKNIVHMVGQTKEKEITNSMYKVLKLCEENKIQSVSFPALGTGAGNLAASQVASAMIDAVANVCIDRPTFLKTVHIVIFQPKMLPDFEEALKKFKKISPKQPQVPTTLLANPTQASSNQTKPPLCLATETASVSFPIGNVEIYGTSSTDIDKIKKFLGDLISEERTSEDVQSRHLDNLPEADKEAILALSRSNQVQVRVVASDKLTVSGKKDDVLDSVLKIRNFLQEAQDRENYEGEVKRLSKTLRWEIAKGEAWASLDPQISFQIEIAFLNKDKSCTYQDKGETFTVDFKEMKQVNTKGASRRIKRTLFGDSDTAVIQTPPTWTKMDGNDLKIIELSSDSAEYKKIESHFLKTSVDPSVSPVQVVKISRIQSQAQWQRYCVLKQAVDKKYPKQKNERLLYHGTTKDICEKINKNGFNRSFCGRNAVVHGDGTYFAKEAWYSCQDQYSNPDENGLKYIYRARVVTGLPCKSRRGMKEPDPLDPKDPSAGLHDCAVDEPQKPFIFVVFCDAGAYPDYLITFKNV